MFIYKITNITNNKCYIGYDSGEIEQEKRWLFHSRNFKHYPTKALYKAIRKYGIEIFTYDVIEDNINDLVILKTREIYWIAEYNSCGTSGYNMTMGGDGNNFITKTDEEKLEISKKISNGNKSFWETVTNEYRQAHGQRSVGNENSRKMRGLAAKHRWELLSDYDKNIQIEKLHSNTKQQSETLKKFYATLTSDERKNKASAMHTSTASIARKNSLNEYWENISKEEYQRKKESNKKAADIAGQKHSKKVRILFPDGSQKIYSSKKEFVKEQGNFIGTLLMKTKENKSHRGLMGWEI